MDFRRWLQDSNDMTSMVDVTFLLLIFFMVTASFVTSQAIGIEPTEQASINTEVTPDPIRITIDEFNQISIEQDESMEIVHSKRELRQAIHEVTTAKNAKVVYIQAHERSRHRVVVEVCDASRSMGIEDIQINPFK